MARKAIIIGDAVVPVRHYATAPFRRFGPETPKWEMVLSVFMIPLIAAGQGGLVLLGLKVRPPTDSSN